MWQILVKHVDPVSTLPESERAAVAHSESAPPRAELIDAPTSAEAIAKIQLEPGEQIAWIRRSDE